jgi:hypothetical protein
VSATAAPPSSDFEPSLAPPAIAGMIATWSPSLNFVLSPSSAVISWLFT